MTIASIQLQSECGKQIYCVVNSMFSIHILQIEANFNPIEHLSFASHNICSLPGIKMLTGVHISVKNKGQYSFLLSKNVDIELLKTEIRTEFENYFINF